MDWTGSEINQLSGFWIGLNLEMCNLYPIFRDLRQFLLVVTLTSAFYLQIFSYTRRRLCLHVDFTRYLVDTYLLCCVRIGLDWIEILGHQLDWTGLGSVNRGFGLDWIISTRSIPYFACNPCPVSRSRVTHSVSRVSQLHLFAIEDSQSSKLLERRSKTRHTSQSWCREIGRCA